MENILNYGTNLFNDGMLIFIIKSIFVLTFSRIILKMIEKAINKSLVNASKTFKTSAPFYINSLRTIIYGLAFFVILADIRPLSNLGKTVLGASSVIAVIVGLAAQEALGNFVAGIILSLYQPFKVGDNIILKDKNIIGVVKTIGFRHTIIRTLENTEVIVPNSVMNTEIIENREIDGKGYRNSLLLDISFESDLDKAKEIITNEVTNHQLLFDARKQRKNLSLVKIYLSNFKEYSVELRVVFYTKNFSDGYQMSSDLRETIKREFDKNGIVIPYPISVNRITKEE